MVKNELIAIEKEAYRKAVLEVIEFSVEDIVTVSGDEPGGDDTGGQVTDKPEDWF